MDASDEVEPETADGTGPEVSPALLTMIPTLEERGLAWEALGASALRVTVPTGDVVMGSVTVLSEATDAVALLAESPDGASAVLLRDGDDLFVVRRDPGVWEHFRARGGPGAVFGSWRTGERTRFRMRHGALWKAVPDALALADRLGVDHLMPPETPPPPPPPSPEPVRRTAAPRRPRAASGTTRASGASGASGKPTQAEEPPAICPRCFMQLPASGRCDCS